MIYISRTSKNGTISIVGISFTGIQAKSKINNIEKNRISQERLKRQNQNYGRAYSWTVLESASNCTCPRAPAVFIEMVKF
jgi:hypothetical protein